MAKSTECPAIASFNLHAEKVLASPKRSISIFFCLSLHTCPEGWRNAFSEVFLFEVKPDNAGEEGGVEQADEQVGGGDGLLQREVEVGRAEHQLRGVDRPHQVVHRIEREVFVEVVGHIVHNHRLDHDIDNEQDDCEAGFTHQHPYHHGKNQVGKEFGEVGGEVVHPAEDFAGGDARGVGETEVKPGNEERQGGKEAERQHEAEFGFEKLAAAHAADYVGTHGEKSELVGDQDEHKHGQQHFDGKPEPAKESDVLPNIRKAEQEPGEKPHHQRCVGFVGHVAQQLGQPDGCRKEHYQIKDRHQPESPVVPDFFPFGE